MYTLQQITEMQKVYDDYLKDNKGKDIQFPDVTFKV